MQWASWPPVAFLAMDRDPTVADRIQRNEAVLQDAGVLAQTIHVRGGGLPALAC